MMIFLIAIWFELGVANNHQRLRKDDERNKLAIAEQAAGESLMKGVLTELLQKMQNGKQDKHRKTGIILSVIHAKGARRASLVESGGRMAAFASASPRCYLDCGCVLLSLPSRDAELGICSRTL